MLNFRRELRAYNFNLRKYSQALDKRMGQILRQGVREWLRYLISVVPVNTGAAISTLQPVAAFLKRVPVLIPPGLTLTEPYSRPELPYVISPESGRDLSAFTITDDKTAPGTFVYSFFWETEILHYWLREYYGQDTSREDLVPGEEQLEEAKKVFNEYVSARLVKHSPIIARYIEKHGRPSMNGPAIDFEPADVDVPF